VVVAARHLGRHLRGDVEVAVGVRVEQRVLVDLELARCRVHPHRRREHDAAGIRAARRLEHS
jgi:hypothetical protein